MLRLLALSALIAAITVFSVAGSQADGRGATSVQAAGHDFTPAKVTISAGEKVVWKQKAGSHTVTFKDGGLDAPLDPDHKTVSRKFSAPGTYHYICTFHVDKGMKGKVVVK